MSKLGRLIVLSLITIILFIAMFTVIPLLLMLLGCSFMDVAQNGAYIFFAVIVYSILIGMGLHNCFDKNYLSKKQAHGVGVRANEADA